MINNPSSKVFRKANMESMITADISHRTSSDPPAPICRYCASTNVIRKGFRYTRSEPNQLYFCKSCKKSFCKDAREVKALPDDVAENYLFDVLSLESLLEIKGLGLSKTTLHRRIRERAKDSPSWEDLSKEFKQQSIWGSVMGIDTTIVKVKGVKCVYLHVVDVKSSDPLAYILCEKEDATSVESVLRRLKNLGYGPQIVASDLAPELLTAVERVFPDAKIQGCLFHLIMLLNRELPTRKRVKGVDRGKVEFWRKVKNFILCAAFAKNGHIRQGYVEQLEHLNADEKVKGVVERFLTNIHYYHTLDEYEEYEMNILCRILYNNVCERQIRLVKDLKGKMKGFKSIEAAHDYIRLYWSIKRRNAAQNQHSKKEDLDFKVPISLFHDYVNLSELSEASRIPREVLNKTALKSGRIVVGDYALTEKELKVIENKLSRMGETSLAAVMQKLGYDQATTTSILEKLGFKVEYRSLDPSKILVYTA